MISRRKFVRNSAITAGMAPLLSFNRTNIPGTSSDQKAADREVWIAGLSQMWMRADTAEEMIKQSIENLNDIMVFNPDLICLPELFPFGMTDRRYVMTEMIEISAKAIERLSEFSSRNNCYIICPVYTSENGKYYNSAVFINRKGDKAGVYNKIHPTIDELEKGVSPGALLQKAVQTEYGLIGAQICFDINWDDGWSMLQKQGCRIVFWPSAFDGGKMVNTKAWEHKYVIATSSNQNNSRLCDISGETVAQTGIWNRSVFCGKVNLEKIFVHLWPYVNRFQEIRNKYGRKVNITIYHEEQWAIIESLSPDVFLKDIMKEFEIRTHEEHIRQAEEAGIRSRS